MTTASIPVDLFNPGQVFACLGFLEVADELLGNAEGGFNWSDPLGVRFELQADGSGNPFEGVLDGLARTTCREVEPKGWPGERAADAVVTDCFPSPLFDHYDKKEKKWTRTSLPVSLAVPLNDRPVSVTLVNWTDGSSRPLFKLYSGNRSAHSIANNMLRGKRSKPTRACPDGKVEIKGLQQLWSENRCQMIEAPFDVLCSMGGSFNFDPRGGWTALDAGFSPDQQSKSGLLDGIAASPVVEILAAWGMEHARPDEFKTRQVRYGVWHGLIPPMLARAALSGVEVIRPLRRFQFMLALSGKNKVVTFAIEELNA
ncbi:MAG: type I-G CRISPR-associated protein Cas8g2 [Planctomycetaceae bacterium]